MAIEEKIKVSSPAYKEFQILLDKDFQDRRLKENEIIKATVTEITKNFIVVDCKAKMEGMIPIEEFKNDDELSKLKVGSLIDVFLERIESFKGEIVISRDKAKKIKAWKKMEKVYETQEEMTGYITGKVKGGYIASSTISPTLIFFKTFEISSFLLFSKTALLETQTLPLFLSILVAITLIGVFIK